MSQQPEFSSPPLPASPAPDRGPAVGSVPLEPPSRVQHHIPLWLEEVELFLRLLVQICVGLTLCYAPWVGTLLASPQWVREFWDENPLFLRFQPLGMIAANGAVRGIVTGLGLLNLWLAFRRAMRRRDL